ncbi:uncharacterized protein I303_106399 [Kwoniella dejecticola CBS 10117]|uniref:Uncharacterized protein n=1 Tax=Kwoniella dejecticola CBS 10117 TaxID=1296121 RepID=A0A1A5ZUU1_9TREE|nr:uncharacterized protein I303_08343 [Kwoniella dejecticola CBS 10117]OBR81573.1 hypothetical protein I303_08343 [Kwoniella dejecticola CBS 10117]
MTAARNVYEIPGLFSNILSFVDREHFWKVLTLEKTSFDAAVRVLWRDVDYQTAKKALRRHTYRSQVYKQSIRYVTLHDSDPPKEKDEASQMDTIEYLVRNLPLLVRAEKRSNARRGRRKHDWTIERIGEGRYKVDILLELNLAEELALRRTRPGDQQYPGLEVERKFNVVLEAPATTRGPPTLAWGAFGDASEIDRLVRRYISYLTNPNKRDSRICGIEISKFYMTLGDAVKMFALRNPDQDQDGYHLPFREINLKTLKPFEIDDFEEFCEAFMENHGDQVEVLALDNYRIASRLRLNKIDSVFTYISETFPNLHHLELPFSIVGQDHKFIPVTQIRVARSLTKSLGNLEKVVINIYSGEGMGGPDARYPFPLEDVAANLAALGARETCKYELRNNSPTFIGMDMSRRLNKEVHDIQRIQR